MRRGVLALAQLHDILDRLAAGHLHAEGRGYLVCKELTLLPACLRTIKIRNGVSQLFWKLMHLGDYAIPRCDGGRACHSPAKGYFVSKKRRRLRRQRPFARFETCSNNVLECLWASGTTDSIVCRPCPKLGGCTTKGDCSVL